MIRSLAAALVFALVMVPSAYAQQAAVTTAQPAASSNVLLSWRTNAYAPAGFMGRVPAVGGGTILVTMEIIDSGKPVNLSGYEVRWYLNDNLFDSGMGKQTITIAVPQLHQDSMEVRVQVVGTPYQANEATISIPLGDPEVVLVSHNNRVLRSGDNIIEAYPYGFNTTDSSNLLYTWSVNGESPDATEDPRSLTVSVDGTPTQAASVTLNVTHPNKPNEQASAQMRLTPLPTTQ